MASAKLSKTKRGAKAPRSAFRAKPTAKPKAKAKPKARAKPTTRPKVKAKVNAKTKPNLEARANVAPKPKPQRRAAIATARGGVEMLGTITCPSGLLAIFDIGLVGYLPRPALEPAIVKAAVPGDRALQVTGTRLGRGRFADCWDHVAVTLGTGDVHTSKKLGEAGVDFARLVCMDIATLDHWQHEDSLDGLADVVFWGRDEGVLAKMMRAPRTADGHGWTNLPLAEAEAKADHAARLKASNKWLLDIDSRPHSHHFRALAAARANPNGAGTLALGGAQMLLFFTSWGDGVFPIYLDLDDHDRPVRVRIQLATPDSNAALHAVNS